MKAVADAKDGFDVGGAAGIRLDFHAQVADVHVQGAVQPGKAAVEQVIHQLGAGKHLPGRAHQHCQQVKFDRGQRDRLAVAR